MLRHYSHFRAILLGKDDTPENVNDRAEVSKVGLQLVSKFNASEAIFVFETEDVIKVWIEHEGSTLPTVESVLVKGVDTTPAPDPSKMKTMLSSGNKAVFAFPRANGPLAGCFRDHAAELRHVVMGKHTDTCM